MPGKLKYTVLPKGACLEGLNKMNNVMVLEGVVMLEEGRVSKLKLDFSVYQLLSQRKLRKLRESQS